MKFNIFTISNKMKSWEENGINFYQKQLAHNHCINFHNLKIKHARNSSKEDIIKKESDIIMKSTHNLSNSIVWERSGKPISSLGLAKVFNDFEQYTNSIDLIIGGAYGLSSEIITTSNYVFSASKLTFPHKLFKIVLCEQIYRACKINTNHPYHK